MQTMCDLVPGQHKLHELRQLGHEHSRHAVSMSLPSYKLVDTSQQDCLHTGAESVHDLLTCLLHVAALSILTMPTLRPG